jgi:hypothetical protein
LDSRHRQPPPAPPGPRNGCAHLRRLARASVGIARPAADALARPAALRRCGDAGWCGHSGLRGRRRARVALLGAARRGGRRGRHGLRGWCAPHATAVLPPARPRLTRRRAQTPTTGASALSTPPPAP